MVFDDEFFDDLARSLPVAQYADGVAFHGFFADSSPGCDLFVNKIRSYLTLPELLTCAQTGKSLHKHCRTWALHEILEHRGTPLEQADRIVLGLEVAQMMRNDACKDYSDCKQRPKRLVVTSPTVQFEATLYHPSELDLIHQMIEFFLASNGAGLVYVRDDLISQLSTYLTTTLRLNDQQPPAGTLPEDLVDRPPSPVLLCAFFGPGVLTQDYEVTERIANLARKGPGGRWGHTLKLEPPSPFMDTSDRMYPEPSTFRWWYTRIFGDPCPRTTKYLIILTYDTAALTSDGRFVAYCIAENESGELDLDLDNPTLAREHREEAKTLYFRPDGCRIRYDFPRNDQSSEEDPLWDLID